MIEVDERDARPSLERWTALALLLPPLVFAWPGPGSLLADDFLPHATGAGAAGLAAIPFVVLILSRRGAARSLGLVLFALFLLALAVRRAWGGILDPFEARLAFLGATTGLAFLLGGASLSGAGTRIYARGTAVLTIVFLLGALADRADEFAGALGNTGSVAMAALPGAIAGAALLTVERGPWRFLGGTALGLFLAFVVRAPVIAGGLAAAAGLAALAVRTQGPSRTVPLVLAALAVLCALAPIALRSGATAADPAADGRSHASTGGFEVRARVWSASLAMLADHPVLGVGPGQFAASFPPHRDPREIDLSSFGRALPVETEVEHPHSDWLAPLLELGAVAGLVWVVFLLVVARGAWRAVRGEDAHRAALAAASIGVLAYALVHAPLTAEPAAASIAFVLFGAVLARGSAFRPWPALLLVLAAPIALAFVRHGRALADLARPGARDAAEVAGTVDRALAACPDSALARTLHARLREERGDDPALVADAWSEVLAVRPFRVEAIMQLAFAHLRAGDLERARAEYERALALDPGHPGIRKNLRLLDVQEGSFGTGREWLGGADPTPQECWVRSESERGNGDPLLADLHEARAHLLWARQHAEGARFPDAVRSYRQCLRVTREHIEGGAPRVRLELAAALAADGRVDEARAEVAGLRLREGDRVALPAWVVAELGRLGLGR